MILKGRLLIVLIVLVSLTKSEFCRIDPDKYEFENKSAKIVCKPNLINFSAEPSTVCVVTCKNNVLR